MLSHVINRTMKSKMIDKVSVATTTDITDDPIEDFCVTNKKHFYRGSEDDVLDRFYNLAKLQKLNLEMSNLDEEEAKEMAYTMNFNMGMVDKKENAMIVASTMTARNT